ATTDMALTAFLALALYAFTLWWARPGMRETLGLGAATGLAILSKFSVFLFLPACIAAILAVYAVFRRDSLPTLWREVGARSMKLSMALLVALFLIWGGYRFSFTAPLKPGGYDRTAITRLFGESGRVHDIASSMAAAPLPLGQLYAGVASVLVHAKAG